MPEPNTDEKWSDSLPEDVRSWEEVTNSKDSESFWKQMTDMKGHIGQSIRIPSEEAGDEDWKTFNEKLVAKVPTLIKRPDPEDAEGMGLLYKAMGHPESADKYEMPKFENESELDLTQVTSFQPIAHKYGLTQKQFAGIIQDMTQGNLTASLETQKNHTEAMQSLRVNWGLKYDTNMEKAANIAIMTNGPPALVQSIKLGTASADTLIWLAEMSDRIDSEGTNLTKDLTKGEDILTPTEARGRLDEILKDKTNPYWVKDHPQNKDMIAKVFKLQKMANPGASDTLDNLRAGAASQ